MQLFEQSHLQFVAQLCVCVSWCTSKKSRGPIYISPRPSFMSIYPRPVALLRAAPVDYAAQKLIIIIRSRKASCRCLFRSLLVRTPFLELSQLNNNDLFPEKNRSTRLCGRSLLAISNHSMDLFFPFLKPTRNPFFLFSF